MNDEHKSEGQGESGSASEGHGLAISALVLGIVGVVSSCVPIVGLPTGIVGLILGVSAKKRGEGGMATASIVLGIIAIGLAIISMIVGGYEVVQDETTVNTTQLLLW
ncbi:DUF4190 domain-containing protein [Poriferisphaera sp. WC338]|uniref:DUF4190 domain-containing protein n=1 Tax=Poriferisphaera sp. WC338 TaxID=3425129 RepID=UPI003D816823